jgi:hypothetical protein
MSFPVGVLPDPCKDVIKNYDDQFSARRRAAVEELGPPPADEEARRVWTARRMSDVTSLQAQANEQLLAIMLDKLTKSLIEELDIDSEGTGIYIKYQNMARLTKKNHSYIFSGVSDMPGWFFQMSGVPYAIPNIIVVMWRTSSGEWKGFTYPMSSHGSTSVSPFRCVRVPEFRCSERGFMILSTRVKNTIVEHSLMRFNDDVDDPNFNNNSDNIVIIDGVYCSISVPYWAAFYFARRCHHVPGYVVDRSHCTVFLTQDASVLTHHFSRGYRLTIVV